MKPTHGRNWRGAAVLAGLALLLASAPAGAQELRYPVGLRGQFTSQGMAVQAVQAGSPAAVAGIQRGDLITKVDGSLVTNQADLVAAINSSGGSVVFTVRKGTTGQLARVTLDLTGGVGPGVMPVVRPGWVATPYLLGVMGDYKQQGMLIKMVGPGTPAAKAGLAPGDLIVRINNFVVRNQPDLFTVLNGSRGTVTLDVRKKGGQAVRLRVDLKAYQLGAIGDFIAQGMRVRVVAPGTAAERIGLVPGDVIVSIDNRPLRNQDDFKAALRASGGSVSLVVRKAPTGTPVRLQADLVNNPLGVWFEPSPNGLRITVVPAGTPAAQIGLERGDILVKVDTTLVRTKRDLMLALKNSGGAATLLIRKGGIGPLAKLDVVFGW